MDRATRMHLDNLHSLDGDQRYEALMFLIKATDRPVDWAYDVWGGFVADLRDRDNHVRAIAALNVGGLFRVDRGPPIHLVWSGGEFATLPPSRRRGRSSGS